MSLQCDFDDPNQGHLTQSMRRALQHAEAYFHGLRFKAETVQQWLANPGETSAHYLSLLILRNTQHQAEVNVAIAEIEAGATRSTYVPNELLAYFRDNPDKGTEVAAHLRSYKL